MAQSARRHTKVGRRYEILVTSTGEAGKTWRFRVGRLSLVLLGSAGVLTCVALTLAVLLFTPIAMIVPLPSPLLEEKYGRQIVETQERLTDLAEEVLLLRDYNTQLRKALGESVLVDSTTGAPLPVSMAASNRTQQADRSPVQPSGTASRIFASPDPQESVYGWQSATTLASVRNVRSPSRFPLLMPAEGYLSQGFDPTKGHFGIDIAGKRGTPVHAASDGRVVFSGWTFEDGNIVILSHGDGVLTIYKHNHALLKSPQTSVRRGEPIALLGTSGKTSLGPHLHFEVWMNGVPQNPAEFLLQL